MEPDKPRKPVPAEDREIDFLICKNCSTSSYVFEMENGRVQEAQCLVCGNDVAAQFDLGDEAGVEEE